MKTYRPILSYFLIPAIGTFLLLLPPGLLGSSLSDDFTASKNSNHMNNHDSPLITTKQMAQVAIIVEDIEAAAAWYASLLGIDPPQPMVAAGHESRPTMYRGQPSDATASLAFIQLDNIQLELIEPDGTPSIWQEFAEKQGQGIQHIAFWVDDIEAAERKFTSRGMEILQSGGWDGGAYSYIDATKQMGVIIELLHNYNQ